MDIDQNLSEERKFQSQMEKQDHLVYHVFGID